MILDFLKKKRDIVDFPGEFSDMQRTKVLADVWKVEGFPEFILTLINKNTQNCAWDAKDNIDMWYCRGAISAFKRLYVAMENSYNRWQKELEKIKKEEQKKEGEHNG